MIKKVKETSGLGNLIFIGCFIALQPKEFLVMDSDDLKNVVTWYGKTLCNFRKEVT